MPGIGQHVDAALGAIEPAIDVVLQDLRRVGNLRLEVAHTPRPSRQRRRAGQRLLAIGRHDRRARAPAQRRVALAAPVLGDQARALLGVAARAGRGRFDEYLDVAGIGHREHSKAQPSAEITIARITLASLAARGHFGGKPDLVTGAGAIDRLQDQFKIECKFQFADHHDRGIAGAKRHQVAAADLALDRKAEVFQEAYDGKMMGGNSAFAFIGTYRDADGDVSVDISTLRHNEDPNFQPLLKADKITLALKGKQRGEQYFFEGGTPQLPGVAFNSVMTPISEEAAPSAVSVEKGGIGNGLYSIHIRMLDGIDAGNTGVMVLHDGRIHGS